MRNSFFKYAGAATLAAGMLFAQTPETSPQPQTEDTPKTEGTQPKTEGTQPKAMGRQGMRRGAMRGNLERMSQQLNLTATQKEKARTIFSSARQSSQPIREQLRANHEKLTAAAKANKSPAEIQKLSNEQGRLLGQLVAIRTEARAKFYRILTPDQRAKADQMHEQFRHRMRSGMRKTTAS